MLTLKQALETSEIEVAEQTLTDYNVGVASNDDEDGGYDVYVQVGAMPPHNRVNVKDLVQAEKEISHLHGYSPDGWYAVEGE